jgi:nitrite reductase/ring-hydroxylating ferredoxin subunit
MDEVGPDFGAGLDASAVPEGHMLSGSLDGKPVLLANVQGQYCAVSATCTHREPHSGKAFLSMALSGAPGITPAFPC